MMIPGDPVTLTHEWHDGGCDGDTDYKSRCNQPPCKNGECKQETVVTTNWHWANGTDTHA